MTVTKWDSDELEQISERTLSYYQERVGEFWAGTREHDVRQNIDALLAHIEGSRPFDILDFGCGPGRDLKTFADLGHRAIGLDGTAEFVAMARDYGGGEVWQQDFLKLDLPLARFDGVFANASLFHIPTQELPRILRELRATLKPGGVLFSSNPRSQNDEGWNRGRYGAYHDLETWRHYLSNAEFLELAHYYRPTGLPRDQQGWLATVWRNPSG